MSCFSYKKPVALRAFFFFVFTILIIFWQLNIDSNCGRLGDQFRVTASSGLPDSQLKRFFYFFYYLNLYPVASKTPVKVFSRQGAENLLLNDGKRLVMEIEHTIRSGERGRIFLYLPNAWMHGTADHASVRLANVLVWIFSLCFVFISFGLCGFGFLGFFWVLLVGSDPFQLFEIYANENVFGWTISSLNILLALNLPLMTRPPKSRSFRFDLIIMILSGIYLGLVREIRSEPFALVFSLVLIYLLLPVKRIRNRVILVISLFATIAATGMLATSYFHHKIDDAFIAVSKAGGSPFRGNGYDYHPIWPPIWCGLGDFDTKHGYEWHDRTAYAYGLPILEKRTGEKFTVNANNNFLNRYHDSQKNYPMKPEFLPGFDRILREKVIHDILTDPAWYLKISMKRLGRIIKVVTPVSFQIGSKALRIYHCGLLAVLGLFFFVMTKNSFALRLVGFTLPLIFTPLLIYSDRGTTYYATFHLMVVAILLASIASRVRKSLHRIEARATGRAALCARFGANCPPVSG